MTNPQRYLLPALTAIALTVIAAISIARGAEIAAGDLVVTSAWARATPPGAKVGAAYVTIENRGGADDTLVALESPAAAMVEPHETAEADGVATMRPLTSPVIAAGGQLEMQPGGVHLMLMGLAAPLKPGAALPLTLTFAKAGRVTIPVAVQPIGADGPDPRATQHQHKM